MGMSLLLYLAIRGIIITGEQQHFYAIRDKWKRKMKGIFFESLYVPETHLYHELYAFFFSNCT